MYGIEHVHVNKLGERFIPGNFTFLNLLLTTKYAASVRFHDQHGNLIRVFNASEVPAITNNVLIRISSVDRLDDAYHAIRTGLKNLPGHIAGKVLREIRNCLNESGSTKNNIFYFEVKVVMETCTNAPVTYVHGATFRSPVYTVPATDSSIRGLESKTVDCCGEGSCPICLEEISEGCVAVILPCSHLFHGDCVTKWLMTSHYCPLCRYEMPKTT